MHVKHQKPATKAEEHIAQHVKGLYQQEFKKQNEEFANQYFDDTPGKDGELTLAGTKALLYALETRIAASGLDPDSTIDRSKAAHLFFGGVTAIADMAGEHTLALQASKFALTGQAMVHGLKTPAINDLHKIADEQHEQGVRVTSFDPQDQEDVVDADFDDGEGLDLNSILETLREKYGIQRSAPAAE